mgnify:FL=1
MDRWGPLLATISYMSRFKLSLHSNVNPHTLLSYVLIPLRVTGFGGSLRVSFCKDRKQKTLKLPNFEDL